MENWCFVAREDDLVDGEPEHVSAEGVDAVLVRAEGELRAFQGLCPHQGALLGEGELIDGRLVCRNHRWRFDAASGSREEGPQCLQQYPVREVDGRIELDLGAVNDGAAASGNRRRGELPGPDGWPLVGNAFQLDEKKMHLDLEDWAREYGDVYRFSAGPNPVIAIAKPAMMAEALQQRPDTFTRFDGTREVFAELGIRGVFSEEGRAWRPQRRLAMRALNPRRLRDFFPTLRLVTERLLARWERAADEQRTIDLQSDMKRFTVDVTTHLAFSEQTNTLGEESSPLLDNLDPVFPLIMKRLKALVPYWRFFKLPSDRRVERGLEEVRTWLSDVIDRTREELEANPERAENPRNFLESMLVARDADGNLYDDEVVFGNAITMLLAGEDTTANTLTWAVHLLLEAPEVVAAIRDSVDGVLERARVPQSRESADEFDIVDSVANETMRLKPVVPHTFLTATEDTVVGDLEIEAGTSVVLLTRMPGLDPERIDEPQRFDPSRWNDTSVLAEMQRSGTFMPFGSGPRICPGRSLALLEIRMVLSMLYRNFEVERVGRAEEVEECLGFTMAPEGLRVKLHRRSQ